MNEQGTKIVEQQQKLYFNSKLYFHDFYDISYDDLEKIQNKARFYAQKENSSEKYLQVITSALTLLMPEITNSYTTDAKLAFFISAIDPELHVYKAYLKETQNKDEQKEKRNQQLQRKIKDLIGVTDPYIVFYEKKFYKRFYRNLENSAEKTKNILALEQILSLYNKDLHIFSSITPSTFAEINTLVAQYESNANLYESASLLSTIPSLDSLPKQLLFFILLGDKDFSILEIYESLSNYKEIYAVIKRKYPLSKYGIKQLIRLEKEIHTIYFPNLEVSKWSSVLKRNYTKYQR